MSLSNWVLEKMFWSKKNEISEEKWIEIVSLSILIDVDKKKSNNVENYILAMAQDIGTIFLNK